MRFIFVVIVVSILFASGCDREPNYATIEGTAIVLLEYDGISEQGFQLSIPKQEIVIKPLTVGATEYRGLLMPKIIYMSTSGNREVSEPLSIIRNGKKYKFYGFHRSLDEVHKRYKNAGGKEVYYPASVFSDTKFFDVHKVKELE
jgi:hypothetical protein